MAATNTRRTLSLCAALAILIASGAYRSWEPAPPAITHALRWDATTSLRWDANDPVSRFADTRTGQVLIENGTTMSCRRVLFDNRTGRLQEAGRIYCGPADEPAQPDANPDRMQLIRKSFQK
jgi:hypothetical protein